MAVTFVRSALMVPGKFPQAHEYLEKRIKWLKEKFGVEASLMALLGGQVGRIATVTEQDSVAQIEKNSARDRRGRTSKGTRHRGRGSVRTRRNKRSDWAENPIIDLIPIA